VAELLNWVALFGLGLVVGGVGLLGAALATTRSRRRRKPRGPRPGARAATIPRPQPAPPLPVPPAPTHHQSPDIRRSILLAETVLLDEVAPAWAQAIPGIPVPPAPPQQPPLVRHIPQPPPPAKNLPRMLGKPGGSMPAVPLTPPIRPAHPIPVRGEPQRGPANPPPAATSWDAFTPVRASNRPPAPEPSRLPEPGHGAAAEPRVRAHAEANRRPNERPFPPNGGRGQPGQGNQGQTCSADEPAGPRANPPSAEPAAGEPADTNRRRPERGYRSRRNPGQPAPSSSRRRPR
jgi:hypothetical protein